MTNRPRIEGYAIVSREGMIAKSDGSDVQPVTKTAQADSSPDWSTQ